MKIVIHKLLTLYFSIAPTQGVDVLVVGSLDDNARKITVHPISKDKHVMADVFNSLPSNIRCNLISIMFPALEELKQQAKNENQGLE